MIADPEFAYGDLGFEGESGKVPPKAAVRLEVELVSHKPPVPFGEINQVEEKLRIGRRKKDRGNFWFQRSNYNFAVQCYRYFFKSRSQLICFQMTVSATELVKQNNLRSVA